MRRLLLGFQRLGIEVLELQSALKLLQALGRCNLIFSRSCFEEAASWGIYLLAVFGLSLQFDLALSC
jgi:hypothetical protein